MIQTLVADLGPWSWWLLAAILLVAELAAPGVFLIWIGAAALVVGALSLALWDASVWGWQIQLLLFAALSVVFAIAGRRYYDRKHATTDEPFLNQREASLVGRTATLQEPITEGRGRIRLDDTWWPVQGADQPAGTRVRIASAHGRTLTVEKA
ncbi:NfeD family protein [Agrobacterium larrymoorei]|uniref:Membrane protein implicated in regulation of membrane protease activity n=1 Tax=Agrobacterium larrymoorei TaxID=160699 RepID=A0ABU0UQB4_9HYPH|nr:NfeD family protein [Agrobacterium larrymoorei]MDQ1186948.1 membrane protein implicated in regulation of membrane protease activity [Agrobacterium larrymoorei]